MTITLGGITLNDHLSWRGRFSSPESAGTEQVTIGNRLVVMRSPIGSSLITLEAIEENDIRKGYFTQSQLESLCSFRDDGDEIILSYHGESFLVVILSSGINVEKTIVKSEYTSDERYIGTIALRRI